MAMTAGKLMAHVASISDADELIGKAVMALCRVLLGLVSETDVDATSIVGRECPVRDTSSGVEQDEQ